MHLISVQVFTLNSDTGTAGHVTWTQVESRFGFGFGPIISNSLNGPNLCAIHCTSYIHQVATPPVLEFVENLEMWQKISSISFTPPVLIFRMTSWQHSNLTIWWRWWASSTCCKQLCLTEGVHIWPCNLPSQSTFRIMTSHWQFDIHQGFKLRRAKSITHPWPLPAAYQQLKLRYNSKLLFRIHKLLKEFYLR